MSGCFVVSYYEAFFVLKGFKAIIDFILYSNIFIAAGAVCFTIETMQLLKIPVTFHPYLFIVFFATLLEYSLHRFFSFYGKEGQELKLSDEWARSNHVIFYIILFISIIGLSVSAVFARRVVLYFLIPMGLISFGYTLPLIKIKGRDFRLREIPALKIVLISIVWSLTTVLLPVIQSGGEITHSILNMGLQRFLFIFAITIPFDIRDKEADTTTSIKTIPMLIGDRNARILADIVLVVFAILAASSFWSSQPVVISFILSALLTILFIHAPKWWKHPYYYYGVLDGTIILQAGLVMVATQL